jgi:Skp family chaperone for outer membrane proteins
MRKALTIAIACAALACVAVFAFLPAMLRAADAPGARKERDIIAVIDMDKVLVEYRKYQHEDAAITARQSALADEIKSGEEQVEGLKRRRDDHKEGGPEWWNCDKEYQKAAAALDSRTQQAQAEINRLDNDLFENVLNDIQAAINKYSKDNGIKIVLWKKRVKLDQPSVEERARVFSQLNVMYADAELDISPAIADIINKAYDEGNKEKGTKPVDSGPVSPKP